MKKHILIACLFLLSCSKDPTTNPAITTGGNISYKLNGVSYGFANGKILKITGTPGATSTSYFIQGFDISYNSVDIFLFTQTDTLREKLYHLIFGSSPGFSVASKAYTVLDTPNYFVDVTVSSYKSGSVSGTFNGKVTHIVSVSPEVLEDAEITEGKFEKLKVEYH